MIVSGWGQFPKIDANILQSTDFASLQQILKNNTHLIPRGNGRSYGDSALSSNILLTKSLNHFLAFDSLTGLLHIQAGVLLAEIIKYFLPRGWFLKVTPGTKQITLGGAIASDVHGKNHHLEGCFSESVQEFRLMLATGEIVTCSREENVDLFLATCGGQGLTGIILDSKIHLKKINSQFIQQTTIKTVNLEETFDVIETNNRVAYSVAWIDCLARGKRLGRSVVMLGDFSDDGNLHYVPTKMKTLPFNFPNVTLNKYTVRLFNEFYYRKIRKKITVQKVKLERFFYPLDSIDQWYKMYGSEGFVQYQFILPKQHSFIGLSEILREIADSGCGSFLSVLKLYGEENHNWLSFPMNGYSLALDFKINSGLFKLLDNLDQLVVKYKGRIYLTKDARMSREVFEQGYPHIEKFRHLRKALKLQNKFQSLQSKRLAI